jgi:hypothetical protein
MTTVNFHFHCLTDQVGDKKCLLFLQPIGSDTTQAKDYEYFAWQNFHPAKGSHNTTVLQTVYSAGVAKYPTTDFGEYTDPVGLDLGQAKKVINTNGSDPHFSSDTTSIPADLVGVYNACTTPDNDLSVIWYVNGNKVVTTNNTADSKMLPNDTSEFELKQTLYVTLATYDSEATYNIQTISRMFTFPFKNDDTDLYFEIDYKDGLVVNQTSSQAYLKSFVRSARFQGTPLIKATKDDVVFSGHGAIEQVQGNTTVPKGVKLVVLAPPAASVSNDLCQAVEFGSAISSLLIVSPKTKETSPTNPVIYQAGSSCPNYVLSPIDPGWLKAGVPHLMGVTQKTPLSDLWSRVEQFIKDGKTITVYWAACTALGGATNPVVTAAP